MTIDWSHDHTAATIDEINVYFWYVIHWKSHTCHYSREGTSADLIKMHKDLAFTNSPPGMFWDNVSLNHSHPMSSTNEFTESSFTLL